MPTSPGKSPDNIMSDVQKPGPNNLDLSTPPDWTESLRSSPSANLVAPPTSTKAKLKRTRLEEEHATRDFHSLDKSELIKMIQSLQEQNLLLTRCLADAHANNAATPQKVTFGSQSTGTGASKYAPKLFNPSDFPPLTDKGKSSDKSATSAIRFTAKAFSAVTKNAAAASKKSNTTTTTKKKLPRQATPKAKEWAVRLFTKSSEDSSSTTSDSPQGYTFIYLPSNKRTSYSELRDRIRLLGINLNRVYSLGRPAKHVISLLIHQGYSEEVLQICEKAGVKPVTNFSPTSAKTIGDPQLLQELKSEIQKEEKAKSLYYNNLLRATVQLRNSKLGLSILKYFSALEQSDNHFVPEVLVTQYLKLRPESVVTHKQRSSKTSILGGFDATSIFASLVSDTANSPHGNADSSLGAEQEDNQVTQHDENAGPDGEMHED